MKEPQGIQKLEKPYMWMAALIMRNGKLNSSIQKKMGSQKDGGLQNRSFRKTAKNIDILSPYDIVVYGN